MPRISVDTARAIFNFPDPPAEVREAQFDGFDDDLRRVAQTQWDKIEDSDLWYYLHDLAYMDLQPDLFAYLFPVCLNFWYKTLMDSRDCAIGDAEFHYGLWRGQVLEKMVTPEQREQIYCFFRDGFLDRLDQERNFVIHQDKQIVGVTWLYRFNSLGVVTPIIDRVWDAWWSFGSYGQAASALIYLSGLLYLQGETPIEIPWAKYPPHATYLWLNDSNIHFDGWQPINLDFFRKTLSVDYFRERVNAACKLLADQPEAAVANKIAADFPSQAWVLEARIEDIIKRLGNPKYNDSEW